MVQIEHRGEAQVHTAGTQLAGQHKARRGRRLTGLEHARARLAFGVLIPKFTQGTHGGQVGEAVVAKALHPSAFMVHRDQQVGPYGLDLGTQVGQLRTALPVATKQDHAAHQGMRQTAAVCLGEAMSLNVQNQGGVCTHAYSKGSAEQRQLRKPGGQQPPAPETAKSRPRKNWRRIRSHRSR